MWLNDDKEDCIGAISYDYPDCDEYSESGLYGRPCPNPQAWIKVDNAWVYEGDYEDYFGEAYAHIYGSNLTDPSGPMAYADSFISALRAYVVFYNFGDFIFWDGSTTYETWSDGVEYSLTGPYHYGSFDGAGCRTNATWGSYDNGTVFYDSVYHCPESLVDDLYISDGPVQFASMQYLFLYQ